jgi:lysophospholipase
LILHNKKPFNGQPLKTLCNKMPSGVNYFTTPDHVSIRYGIWLCGQEKEGTVLLLGGRSEFMEKYSETIARLTNRGYDVHSMDWRGQGLSDRSLPDRQKGHIEDFNDFVRDLREFFVRVIEPVAQRPLILLAHSLGGHVAVRFVHDFPGTVDRMILTSPMMDINFSPLPKIIIRFLVRLMVMGGLSSAYALGNGPYRVSSQRFKGNPLTSDCIRYQDHVNAVKQNPDLALGGVTYGWLAAALSSVDIISRPGYVEVIKTPTLIAIAENDRVVSRKAQESICSRMPCCTARIIQSARHEILKEKDEVQRQFWQAFDAFVG